MDPSNHLDNPVQSSPSWLSCNVIVITFIRKMLENRPEDAIGSLVKTVETVETEKRILKYLTL